MQIGYVLMMAATAEAADTRVWRLAVDYSMVGISGLDAHFVSSYPHLNEEPDSLWVEKRG
jgi:hypothetical protein